MILDVTTSFAPISCLTERQVCGETMDKEASGGSPPSCEALETCRSSYQHSLNALWLDLKLLGLITVSLLCQTKENEQ